MNEDDLKELNDTIDAVLASHFDIELLDRGGPRDERLRPKLQKQYDTDRSELILLIDGLCSEAARTGRYERYPEASGAIALKDQK